MKSSHQSAGQPRQRGRIALLRNVRFRRAGAHRDRRRDIDRHREAERPSETEWDDELEP